MADEAISIFLKSPGFLWLACLPGEGRASDRPVHQLDVGGRGHPPTKKWSAVLLLLSLKYLLSRIVINIDHLKFDIELLGKFPLPRVC